MNVFQKDDAWQREIRDRLLKPWYERVAYEGRFVFADKGILATKIQKELAIDTIAQIKDGGITGVEEKIVRWPGYQYQCFTFETMSCTVPGREKLGWMHYSVCDVLLYCFVQEDNASIIAYAIPFPALKKWFFKDDHYLQYRPTKTEQINATECVIVPINHVMKNVPGCKIYQIAMEEVKE